MTPMAKTDKPKDPRGGIRQGAGRKARYDEPTTTVAFRVPVSTKEGIDRMKAAGEDVTSWLCEKVRMHISSDTFIRIEN